MMTRTIAREIAVHLIYEQGFGERTAAQTLEQALTEENFGQLAEEEALYKEFPDEIQRAYINELVKGVYDHCPELDDYISRYSIGWSFSRIPRVAVAVMRAAMYEVLYMPDIPNAAAIDAAVEIAKKYESPEVVSFINGILGSFVREELQTDVQNAPESEEQAKQ